MTVGDMVAQAMARFGAGEVLRVIDLARLRIGRTDAAGRVERLESGEWQVSLKGPTIDLSPVIDGEEEAPDGARPADARRSQGPSRPAMALRAAARPPTPHPT